MADDANRKLPNTPTDVPTTDSGEAAATTATTEEPVKLKQTVEIKDVGPCKKHVKVTVDRERHRQAVRREVHGARPAAISRRCAASGPARRRARSSRSSTTTRSPMRSRRRC